MCFGIFINIPNKDIIPIKIERLRKFNSIIYC